MSKPMLSQIHISNLFTIRSEQTLKHRRDSIDAILEYIRTAHIREAEHLRQIHGRDVTLPTVAASGVGRGIDEAELREG